MKRELGRKTLMISSAWLFTIAIAFWVGSHWASSRGGNSLSVVGEQDFEKAQETIERIVVIRRFSGETPTLDPAESFPPQVQHALTRALREAEPHRRGYAIDVILSGLVLNDIGEAVAFIGNLPLGARRDEMLERLLLRWGELDGRSALAFAFEHSEHWNLEAAVSSALAGWSKSDPESAWDWTVENPGAGPFQSERINAVIREISQDNPQIGFSLAASVANEALRTSALKTVADHLFATDQFRDRLSWFSDLPESSVRQITIDHIARLWSRYEPLYAAEWVLDISENRSNSMALTTIASNWAASDPQRAAQWAVALPAGAARVSSVAAVVDSWLRAGDTAVAAEWLNRQPSHPDYDRAVKQVALTVMSEDPEAAMTWAESITEDRLREVTVTMVASRWMMRDPESATAYLETAELSYPPETVILRDPSIEVLRFSVPEGGAEIRPSLSSSQEGTYMGVEEASTSEGDQNEPLTVNP